MRGIDEQQLARLQAPAGPDAGAKTPGEIALVAIVGVLALLRGRSQAPSKTAQVRDDALAGTGLKSGESTSRTVAGTASADGKFINPVCGMAISMATPMHIEKYEE